jgi:hypothetical protein
MAAPALVGAVPAASVEAAPAGGPHAASLTAHAACTSGWIEGDRRCITVGQFCRHRASANRDYHRYGFHCGKRDRRGNYHLIYY